MRKQLNDDMMDSIVGGKITFDWDGATGHCGLDGDKSYTFTNKQQFVGRAIDCYNAGYSDSETLQKLREEGIIW